MPPYAVPFVREAGKWVGADFSPSPFSSDHDDEVASLASAAGGFGTKVPTPRLPAKDWKTKGSPRASPKLKRKGKKDDGYGVGYCGQGEGWFSGCLA